MFEVERGTQWITLTMLQVAFRLLSKVTVTSCRYYIKCSMCRPCCWTTHSSRRRHWPMARSMKRCDSFLHSVTLSFYTTQSRLRAASYSGGVRMFTAQGKRLCCYPANQISNWYSYGYSDGIGMDCEQYLMQFLVNDNFSYHKMPPLC